MEAVTWAHHIRFILSSYWTKSMTMWLILCGVVMVHLIIPPSFSPHSSGCMPTVLNKRCWNTQVQFGLSADLNHHQKSGSSSAKLQSHSFLNNSLFRCELHHNSHQIKHKYFTLNSHFVPLFSMMYTVLLEHRDVFGIPYLRHVIYWNENDTYLDMYML